MRKEQRMNGRKTVMTGLLCGAMLTGAMRTEIVYAAPSLSASADAAGVTEGDYVNIDVEIGDNPAFSTLGATLYYDSSVLRYDSSTWNQGFSGSDMQMASDTGDGVNLSVVCEDSYAQDGTVVTVRFQAVEDSASIPVTLVLRDLADSDLTDISDCIVADEVFTPEESEPSQENDTSDLQNPQDATDISIMDEEADDQTPAAVTRTDTDADEVSVATQQISGTDNGTHAAAVTQTRASRPDENYKTGIGLGSDMFLIGAAASGILALVLAVRRRREEES